jgi:SCY1-like protein 1
MTRLTDMVKNMVSPTFLSNVSRPDFQPETIQTESSANMGPITTTSAANGTGQAGLVNSATGAAGVLAGWAISSLSKQMSSTEVHSTMSATTRSPIPGAYTSVSPTPSTSSTVAPSAPVPGFGTTSKSSMKLKPKVAAPVESLADEWDDGGAANAWGTDDLIDVNADTDDWAAFESAPVPEIVVPPPQSYYVKPTTNGSTKPAAAPVTSVAPSVKSVAPSVKSVTPSVKSVAPPVKSTPTPSPKPSSKPVMPTAPVSDGWDDDVEEPPRSAPTPPSASVTPSLANMTKEEKELEMARRREERKARIAAMKEQKKGKA